jgi:hypothetical protein
LAAFPPQAMAMVCCGQTSGVAVDVGYHCTRVMPVTNLHCSPHSVSVANLGGLRQTELFANCCQLSFEGKRADGGLPQLLATGRISLAQLDALKRQMLSDRSAAALSKGTGPFVAAASEALSARDAHWHRLSTLWGNEPAGNKGSPHPHSLRYVLPNKDVITLGAESAALDAISMLFTFDGVDPSTPSVGTPLLCRLANLQHSAAVRGLGGTTQSVVLAGGPMSDPLANHFLRSQLESTGFLGPASRRSALQLRDCLGSGCLGAMLLAELSTFSSLSVDRASFLEEGPLATVRALGV